MGSKIDSSKIHSFKNLTEVYKEGILGDLTHRIIWKKFVAHLKINIFIMIYIKSFTLLLYEIDSTSNIKLLLTVGSF